jgi:hypothetical protein
LESSPQILTMLLSHIGLASASSSPSSMLSGAGNHHHQRFSFQSTFNDSPLPNTLYHSPAAPSTFNSTVYSTPARHRDGSSHTRAQSDTFIHLPQDHTMSMPHPHSTPYNHQESSPFSFASHKDVSRMHHQPYQEATSSVSTLQHQLNESR